MYHPTIMQAGLMLLVATCLLPLASFAQAGGDQFMARSLQTSMLTYDDKPFHAVMEIAPSVDTLPSSYSGKVEVWWASPKRYRVAVSSPDFSFDRVLDGDKLKENRDGSFYPRWLESFVRVLVDPVPVDQFKESAGAVFLGGQQGFGISTQPCIRRDDKTNGITNDLTWGQLCFTGPVLSSITTFNYSIYMDHWSPFDGKDIPREFRVFVLDSQEVTGRLTTLETFSSNDAAKIDATTPSLTADPLRTEFVSTLREESMVEFAPKIEWPAVHEGKTEGYMIVYARTDVTGQVRESSTHNSDNPGLEAFGMQQAVKYRFKPLLVDGVARQIEMPLVLHFTSRTDSPIPILTTAEMKKQTISCRTIPVPSNALSPGQHAIVRATVGPGGNVIGIQPISQAPWGMLIKPWNSVKDCQFRPYFVNGKPVTYKGDVELR